MNKSPSVFKKPPIDYLLSMKRTPELKIRTVSRGAKYFGLIYAKIYKLWHYRSSRHLPDIFRRREPCKFPECMYERVTVAEPASRRQLTEIDLFSSFDTDQVFAILDPQLVEIVGEIHPLSLIDDGRQLIGRYTDGARQLFDRIMWL